MTEDLIQKCNSFFETNIEAYYEKSQHITTMELGHAFYTLQNNIKLEIEKARRARLVR